MSEISVQIPGELAERLEKLAKRTGRTTSSYIQQALEEHLQELEDIDVAEQRLDDLGNGRSRTYTTEEVERELGLAD